MNEMSIATQGTDQASPRAVTSAATKRPRQRRRHFLIDKSRQIRTSLLTSGLAVFLLAVINIAFYVLRTSQTTILASVAPKLKPVLEEQDARLAIMLVLFSIVFVLGVFAITIFQTHLTAGAVFAVSRTLERVRDGDYQATLRLRPRDSLLKLIQPFNEMAGSLRSKALAEAEELDQLAEMASSDGPDNSDLAAALRDLSAKKRILGS